VVSDRGGVLVIDDPLSLLSLGIWLFAAGMWPVAFLFGACSACCNQCPWMLNFDRCLYWEDITLSQVDGISYQTGDTQKISLRKFGTAVEYLSAGQGNLQIFNVQSEILVPLQISISASGTNRTPVGETRTQVWRFNRAAPTSPASATYDILGPAWHLEVELSVTGVATQAESGVTTSIGVDSEGQTKLFFVVNQWTATITSSQTVSILPVGLQRWGPGLAGTQSFRLTTAGAVATLVSGTSYSGWSVSKTFGLTITRHALAVRYTGSGGGVFLDDTNVIEFLNGDRTLTAPSRRLTILPNNILCGVNNFGLAVNLEVVPETLSLQYDAAYIASSPTFCYDNDDRPTLLYGGCGATGWFGRWGNFFSTSVSVQPSAFFGGSTILWMIINGPFRTSAPVSSIASVSWGGSEPGKFERRVYSSTSTCPPGTILCHGRLCLPQFHEITVNFPDGAETVTGQISCSANTPGLTAASLPVSYGYTYPPFTQCQGFYDRIRDTGDACHYFIALSVSVQGTLDDFCEESGGNTSSFLGSANIDRFQHVGCDMGIDPLTGEPRPQELQFKIVGEEFGPFAAEICGPYNGTIQPDYLGCGFLAFPVSGCPNFPDALFVNIAGAVGVDWEYTPFEVIPPGPAGGGEFVNGPGDGPCVLVTVSIDGLSVANNTSLASAQAGNCYYARLGFATPTSCGTISHAECDDCTPEVTIISGAEFARVTYLASGDKAGLIEIVALTTWFAGQGVTFTVTCNGSITRTLSRAFEVPTPPQNLTVVRGPCSEAFLEWQAPEFDGGTPITSYSVQFRRVGVAAWTTFGTVSPPALSATVTGLVRVGYEFRVLAVNSVGDSAESNIAQSGFALGAPTNLTFTRDPCNQVQLSWTPPAQSECVVVANYRLERRLNFTGQFVDSGTVAGTATTGTITGLLSTGRYEFRVARIADDGPDLFSNTVTSGTVPAVPTNVVGSLGVNSGEVNLVWDAVEQQCFPNTDYNVQLRPSTTNFWSFFARAASANKSATVTGLTSGVTYFFRVRASNTFADSSFSEQSNSVTIP
jgi:hypothetical protein